MKSILLIGLGRFGKHIALHLNHLGHQVMAVDTSEERVEAVLPLVTNAQIGDSTNADFFESLGVRNYDVCIVAIGSNFQSSLETTSLLSELGARFVVSRAATDVQEKFLLRNGANEVVYPEKQVAKWASIRYADDHILDSPADADIPVLVHDAEVAGVQPALFVDDLPGCFRVFVVSFHHVRTFDPDFTLSALVGIVDFNLYAFHDGTYSLKEGL